MNFEAMLIEKENKLNSTLMTLTEQAFLEGEISMLKQILAEGEE